jgi:Helix-turn-helix domain
VELRALRESAGRPKYATLAKRTGRSQTALSEAAGGQRLPNWETVEAFVQGCHGDPVAWHQRWEEVAAEGIACT